jgi:uncharacterized damage-inducible protein DinB
MKRYDVPPVEGLDREVGLLLAMLDDGTREWRGELGDVPDEAVVWQPFRNGHSIGAVILHIAAVEVYWLHHVAGGREQSPEEEERLMGDAVDQYAVRWPAPPACPLAWYFEQHDAVRARTRAIISEINDLERITEDAGHSGKREFTLRWLLHHVITHEAYHGGQAVLLSLMRENLGG